MKKKALIPKRLFIVITSLLILTISIILAISFYTLYQITFAGDRVLYGTKLSDVAREIRTELLKQQNLTSVSFTTSDNLKLSGLLLMRPKAKANLVLCHGHRSAKEFMYAFIDMFPEWNILMFDFRAHGESDGKITSIGCHEYKDVIAAAKYLRTQTPSTSNIKLPLIIIGISMGGASSIKAAEMEPGLCDAMIIDSAYAKLDSTVIKAFSQKSPLPHYPFFPIIKQLFHILAKCNVHSMNPISSVRSIPQPILFIHSCDDSYISPNNAIKLYAHAQNKNSKLWIAPHCRHAWLHSYHSKLYKKHVFKFLKQVLPQAIT